MKIGKEKKKKKDESVAKNTRRSASELVARVTFASQNWFKKEKQL